MRITDPVRAPHLFEQLRASADLRGPAAQLLEQCELDASHGNVVVANADLLAADIDRQGAEGDDRSMDRVPAGMQLPWTAQERLAAGGEFVGIDWSGYHVVGAGTQGTNPHVVGIGGSDADNIRVRQFTHRVEQAAAVRAGQLEIDHDNIGREGGGQSECRFSLCRGADRETAGAQRGRGNTTQQCVADCQEHTWCQLCIRFHWFFLPPRGVSG